MVATWASTLHQHLPSALEIVHATTSHRPHQSSGPCCRLDSRRLVPNLPKLSCSTCASSLCSSERQHPPSTCHPNKSCVCRVPSGVFHTMNFVLFTKWAWMDPPVRPLHVATLASTLPILTRAYEWNKSLQLFDISLSNLALRRTSSSHAIGSCSCRHCKTETGRNPF